MEYLSIADIETSDDDAILSNSSLSKVRLNQQKIIKSGLKVSILGTKASYFYFTRLLTVQTRNQNEINHNIVMNYNKKKTYISDTSEI